MLALTVVGLSLGAVTWFWEPSDEPQDPDATEAVWSLNADTIVKVEIRRQSDTVIVSREVGSEWRVEQPWTGVADPDTIHDLLDALVEVERGVAIEGVTDRAEFGLGDPPTALVFVTDLGGGVATATFGDEAPVGFRTYALSAADEVVAVGGRPVKSLLAKSSDFKDRRLFHFDPAAVRRVTIESAEGRLSVHGEATSWWMDGFSRADPDRVDDLVMGLLNVRIDEFLDLSDTITEPAIVVSVELADGSISGLKIGDPTPLGVLVEYDGGFGTVFADALRLLVQGPRDLGDKRAFPIDHERTVRVSVTRGASTWTAIQAGTTWTVDGVETIAAQDVIDALADAVMHYRREPVAPMADLYAIIEVERGGSVQTIDVGQLDGVDFRVAKDRAGGEPYLIPVVDLAVLDQPFPKGK